MNPLVRRPSNFVKPDSTALEPPRGRAHAGFLRALAILIAVIVIAASCRQIFRIEPVQLATDASLGDGVVVDGPLDGMPSEAGVCPAICTSCDLVGHVCAIDCNLTAACNNMITCPAGFACQVKCDANNACHNGINCNLATSCDITCSGQSSCKNLQCGAGACRVSCTGVNSCSNNIACGPSCACDVDCVATGSCQTGITCTNVACNSGSGCTSMPAGCNGCP